MPPPSGAPGRRSASPELGAGLGRSGVSRQPRPAPPRSTRAAPARHLPPRPAPPRSTRAAPARHLPPRPAPAPPAPRPAAPEPHLPATCPRAPRAPPRSTRAAPARHLPPRPPRPAPQHPSRTCPPPAPGRRHGPAARGHTRRRSRALAHARSRGAAPPRKPSPPLRTPEPGEATRLRTPARADNCGALTSGPEPEPEPEPGRPACAEHSGGPRGSENRTARGTPGRPRSSARGSGGARARPAAPSLRVTTATRAHASPARGGPRALPLSLHGPRRRSLPSSRLPARWKRSFPVSMIPDGLRQEPLSNAQKRVVQGSYERTTQVKEDPLRMCLRNEDTPMHRSTPPGSSLGPAMS
ncbi:hypothetical protein VULLAG_LOCUS21344 [Vulpes lagopus]